MKKLKYSLLSGLVFGIIIGIYCYVTNKEEIAIVLSIFCFITFSIISYFKMFSKIDFSEEFEKIDKKSIIYSGLANHFKDNISVGGTLYLLENKIVFQTNAINFAQRHQKIIELNEIDKTDFRKTMGLINNGIFIKTKDNVMEEFVVNKREIWKEQIEKVMKINSSEIAKQTETERSTNG
jgi:ABC-type transport system involved in multi-copper enzyme maturation permease subunit